MDGPASARALLLFALPGALRWQQTYEGWVYYPHPETKKRNFQNPSLLEVIAALIPDIKYGDELEVQVNPERIEVSRCCRNLSSHLESSGTVTGQIRSSPDHVYVQPRHVA